MGVLAFDIAVESSFATVFEAIDVGVDLFRGHCGEKSDCRGRLDNLWTVRLVLLMNQLIVIVDCKLNTCRFKFKVV